VNADALEIILNNTSADIAQDVRDRVRSLLTMTAYRPLSDTPDLDTANAVGEVVRSMVAEYAQREHGLADHGTTLTAMIFNTTLDHIDWTEVGRYYYVTAER
jgi:hypothetical protein